MSVNLVVLQGRIPFDHELKELEGDKAFLGFSLSVQRNYKPEGEKYYPEDLIYCKAFNQKAKFIAQYFPKGSYVVIEGELRRDDDYEKDGKTEKGQMYVNVTNANFEPGQKSEGSTSAPAEKPAAKAAASAKKAPTANPLFGNKKSPF